MDDDDLEILREAVVKAARECDDGMLLDLICKILITDGTQ